MVSACMSGTRGSGILSSTGDVLVRGVGVVCDMCMRLARSGVAVLHLMDICFLACICLWQISQIQTSCLKLSDLDWSRHHPLL